MQSLRDAAVLLVLVLALLSVRFERPTSVEGRGAGQALASTAPIEAEPIELDACPALGLHAVEALRRAPLPPARKAPSTPRVLTVRVIESCSST